MGGENIIETEIVYKSADTSNEYTEEEIQELCCKEVDPFPPCVETGKVEPWPGSTDHFPQSAKTAIEKASHDPLFEVVFTERKNPCGEMWTEYDKQSCCDDPDIPELLWNVDSEVQVADFSYAWIAWEGGKAPYTIEIEGDGFYTNTHYTTKKITVNELTTRIYTSEACGSCAIKIKDSCSTVVNGTVRSVNGHWAAPYKCFQINWSTGSSHWDNRLTDFDYNPENCQPRGLGFGSLPYGRYHAISVWSYYWTGGDWLPWVVSLHKYGYLPAFERELAKSPLPQLVGGVNAGPPDETYTCPGTGVSCEWIC